MNWSHILIRTYFFGVILNVEMGNVYQLYHWNYHFCPRTQVKWWVNDLSHLLCCPTSRVCVEIHEQRFRNSEIKWSQHGTGYMLPFLFKDIMKIHVFVVSTPQLLFSESHCLAVFSVEIDGGCTLIQFFWYQGPRFHRVTPLFLMDPNGSSQRGLSCSTTARGPVNSGPFTIPKWP